MRTSAPIDIIAAGNGCGEGVVWDSRRQALWWTDIPGRRLHRYDWASRTQRVSHLISKDGIWNDNFGNGHFDRGYGDLTNSVDYATSHDVADAPRLMNTLLGSVLREQRLGPGDVPDVRAAVDTSQTNPAG